MAVVLVVDDSQSVRKSLIRMLQAQGHEVLGAADGADAIRVALEERPAIIVMDLYMPVLSGIEAARKIREHPQLSGIPMLALSAAPVDVAPAEGSQPLPFVKVLAKPCAAADLLQAIGAVLQESKQGGI